jgi:uncharacterized protein YkwD
LLLPFALLAAPTPPPAQDYGQEQNLKPTALEAAAMKTLGEVLPGRGENRLEFDPRLLAAARDLAREIQADLPRQAEIATPNHALELLDRHGGYDATLQVRSLIFGSAGDILSSIKLDCGPGQLPAMTHMAVGIAPPARGRPFGVAAIFLVDRRAQLERFPRAVACPSSPTLRGRLVNVCRGLEPTVVITAPDGRVKNLRVSRDADYFSVSIPFDRPGVYRVEVVAVGDGRAEMSALLKVQAGDATLDERGVFVVTGPEAAPRDEAEAEDTMVVMVNQVRLREGLEILLPDPRLYVMAREHSQDMMANRYVGHLSPSQGRLEDRARAAGVGGYLSENVALNISLVQAMNSLLESPVHRRVILDPKVKHLGVGIAFDSASGTRHYYITQEFGE